MRLNAVFVNVGYEKEGCKDAKNGKKLTAPFALTRVGLDLPHS